MSDLLWKKPVQIPLKIPMLIVLRKTLIAWINDGATAVCKVIHMEILNPNWHELWKEEKCSSFAPPWSKFYKTQWASNYPNWSQFSPPKMFRNFEKISADKIQSKNYKGGKSTLPHANYGWRKLNTLKLQNVKEGCSVI